MTSEARRLEFERLRQELRAEYDALVRARAWMNTQAPRIMDSLGPMRPMAFPVVQPILDAIDEAAKLVADEYVKLAPIEWDFAAIAARDANIWQHVARAARESRATVEWIDGDRDLDDGPAPGNHDGARPPVDVNRAHPWRGEAGRAYSSQIVHQATAAEYIASVADDTARFLTATGTAFAAMLAELIGLMVQARVQLILIIIGFSSVAFAILSGGVGFVWPLVTFIGAAAQRLTMLEPQVLKYKAAYERLNREIALGVEGLRTKLGAGVPAVFRHEASHSWPDPTRYRSYPHVGVDARTAQPRVMTETQYHVDAATGRTEDELRRRR